MDDNPQNKVVRGRAHERIKKEARDGLHALLDRALDDGPSDVVFRITQFFNELIAGVP